MESLFVELLAWVNAHPLWAGLAVFAIAFAESAAIIGVLVPGVAIMFGIGALIGAGAANFWTMCVWAASGAVLGDGLSFWLGTRYESALRNIWPFRRIPDALDKGEAFFRRYGAMSIVFGRFFGPVRATVPLVAGMLKMPTGQFVAANVGSALLWAPAYLLPGVVFGASLELASEVALRLVLIALSLLGLVWFTGWLVHRLFNWLQPHTNELLQRALAIGDRHTVVRRIANAIANPRHPEARGLGALGVALVIATVGLITLSALFPADVPWAAFDRFTADMLQSLRTQLAENILAVFASLGELPTTLMIGSICAVLFVIYRKPIALWHWAGALITLLIAAGLLKQLVPVAVPGQLAPDASTLLAAVPLGLLVIMVAPSVNLRFRWLAYALGTITIVIALFSRLYLGLGYLHSSITAIMLSLVWTAAIGIAYRTHTPGRPLPVALAGLLGIGVVAGVQVSHSIARPGVATTPPAAMESLASEQWRSKAWQTLPRMREDLRHSSNLPLNLQYAGDIAWLDAKLHDAGWKKVEQLTARALLRLLSTSAPLDQLPLLPHVHKGRYEAVAWVLNQPDRRLVLRLWLSNFEITATGPIWLGEVSSQVKQVRAGLLAYGVTTPTFEKSVAELAASLSPLVQVTDNDGVLLLMRPR